MTGKLMAACSVTLLVSVPLTLLVRDYLSGDALPEGARVHTIASRVLGEERQLIVQLPESHGRDAGRRYPVVYVLDGTSQDVHTARTAALMARIGAMPELIVVGLPNVSGEGRQRDYTPPFMVQDAERPDGPRGRADRFLDFVEREAMPFVDREYRTTSSRMLAGHSRGGLLVFYSLMARPGLFEAHFAHSPALWRDDTVIVKGMERFLSEHPDIATHLYLSIGSEENEKMMAAFDEARAMLARVAGRGLRWHAEVVAGADHQTNGEVATPLGFSRVFQGWSPDAGASVSRRAARPTS
jgi:hypothetical protein